MCPGKQVIQRSGDGPSESTKATLWMGFSRSNPCQEVFCPLEIPLPSPYGETAVMDIPGRLPAHWASHSRAPYVHGHSIIPFSLALSLVQGSWLTVCRAALHPCSWTHINIDWRDNAIVKVLILPWLLPLVLGQSHEVVCFHWTPPHLYSSFSS